MSDRAASLRPTLRELEVLRALLSARKTTAAASRLGMSQPAVSRAVAGLEARVGHALFRREGGRLAHTAEALALGEAAGPILAALDRLGGGEPRGGGAVLRLAAATTLAHGFLHRLLAAFLAGEPGARAQVEVGTTDGVVAAVAEGAADIGVVDLRPRHEALRVEPFRRADAHAVLPPGHPLCAREVLVPADFAGLPFVALARRFAVRARVDALFEAAGIERRIVAETATATLAAALVREGAGVALLNPFPLALDPGCGVVFRPFAPAVPYESCFLLPARGPAAPAARRFADFVRARQPEDGLSTPLRDADEAQPDDTPPSRYGRPS